MELKSLLNPVSIPNGPIRCSRNNILNNSFNTFPLLFQTYNKNNDPNNNNNQNNNVTNEKSLLRSSNNEDLETIINAISSLKNNIYLKDNNNNQNNNSNNNNNNQTITNVKIENITEACPSSPVSSEMSDDIKSEDDHHHHDHDHHTKIAHGGQANGKKPRKSYEVYKKLEILDEKNKHGMSFVVEKYHISRSIISRWLSNIEKYKSFNKKNLKKLHKGPKASFSMEQENMIIEKINQCRQVGEQVSGETIKKFALELSKELNNTSFKASSGWLENFKNRHSLQLK
ncbi:hypothetical protein CYY_003220 [Polysphondylium violaceum]|uniref:HTH CENPB-type domain-containing protein n=1 Tax=Polysphondylium violaceum TaxID=133409 RepID=A0A8J4PYV0_9MYCE|nr:hypothetical protein CYY_003220 [Polysphondylium violaceum]